MWDVELSLGICRIFPPWEQGIDSRHVILIATSQRDSSTTWYHIIGGGLQSPAHPFTVLVGRQNLNMGMIREQTMIATFHEKHLGVLESAVEDAGCNLSHFWVMDVVTRLMEEKLIHLPAYWRCRTAVMSELPRGVARDYYLPPEGRWRELAPPPSSDLGAGLPARFEGAVLAVEGAGGDAGPSPQVDTAGGDGADFVKVLRPAVSESTLSDWEIVGEDEAFREDVVEQGWVLLDQ
ncbi:hypothetical protein B0T25DRAFT_563832 [Lasiosphaeria hispida]|uniref:Uncharacterized protein n=1 Tax=Lasiosphaeria hispida TaxID=260671 RepID=A0AAJ0MH11_9PEZI|nr:hypothetical protein B0T25DRAFT_563832 [Lasiosphaeria hispida]